MNFTFTETRVQCGSDSHLFRDGEKDLHCGVCMYIYKLRHSMSALVGDPDPYLQVFQS